MKLYNLGNKSFETDYKVQMKCFLFFLLMNVKEPFTIS